MNRRSYTPGSGSEQLKLLAFLVRPSKKHANFLEFIKRVYDEKMKLPTIEDLAKAQKHALPRPLQNQKWYGWDDTLHLWTRLDLTFPHNKAHTVTFECSFKYHWLGGNANCKCSIHMQEEERMQKNIIFSSPCAERDWTDLKFDFEVHPGKKYSLWYKMGGGGGHILCVRNVSVKTLIKHDDVTTISGTSIDTNSVEHEAKRDDDPTGGTSSVEHEAKRDDDTTSDNSVVDDAERDDDTTSDTTSDSSSVEHEAERDDDTASDTTSDNSSVEHEAKMKLLTAEELAIAQKNALLHTLTDQVWDDPDDTPHLWTSLTFAFPDKVHYVSFTCKFKYDGDGNCKGLIRIVESPEEEEDLDGAEKTIIYSSPCAEDDWTDLKCDFEVKSKKKYSLWYKMGGGDPHKLHVQNASVRKMNRSKFEALVKAKPIRSSYIKGLKDETVILGEEVPLKHTANGASYRDIDVELRGITFRQLRELYNLALRLCVEEAWYDYQGKRVTRESMNLYDIVKYIVKPFTEATRKSFVESLPSTAGTQPPRFFMSHWWGEPFPLTLDCLERFIHDFSSNYRDEQDARGGGMTIDTPIWICAFANNQWDLNEDMADDPKESSFAKAMGIACFRTVSILDANGVMLTRLWCNYEQYLVHILAKKKGVDGLMTFYTAHRCKDWMGRERAAVGIVPGEDCRGFPFDLVFNSLGKIDIRSAEVSVEADGRMIRNAVAGNNNLTAEPPADHENYDVLNNEVKASLVSSFSVLVAAHKAGGEVWESTLKILSKGTMTGKFTLAFSSFEPRLTSMEARELMIHVPFTCTGLHICNAYGEDCEGAIDGLLEWLEKKDANSLTYLGCVVCKVGDKERGRAAGSRLAAALASNHAQSMERLHLNYTDWIDSGNVSDWKSALEAMPNLKELSFIDTGLLKEEQDILKNATHTKDVTFEYSY